MITDRFLDFLSLLRRASLRRSKIHNTKKHQHGVCWCVELKRPQTTHHDARHASIHTHKKEHTTASLKPHEKREETFLVLIIIPFFPLSFFILILAGLNICQARLTVRSLLSESLGNLFRVVQFFIILVPLVNLKLLNGEVSPD